MEPAIFGTLLERALDKRQRHKLGAHYTPRAYVERLVVPTVMDPLRADWRDVQAAAVALSAQGKEDEARDTVRAFARLGVSNDTWGVTAWGRNITDEKYLQEIIPAPEFGGSFIHDSPGAAFGVDVRYSFR